MPPSEDLQLLEHYFLALLAQGTSFAMKCNDRTNTQSAGSGYSPSVPIHSTGSSSNTSNASVHLARRQ